MKHLSTDTIEAVVMGISPPTPEVRQHLAECESCAMRVQREAQLEMLLHSAAESAPAWSSRMDWRGGLRVAAAVLILAAGSIWLLHARPDSRTQQPRVMERPPTTVAFGRDVQSPSDFGRWARPYAPGLEQSMTTSLLPGDSL